MAGLEAHPNEEYRDSLISTEQKSTEQYDKAVLTLSGGALGVSFAFVRDLVGPDAVVCPGLLLVGWTCWALSCCSVLFSFYFSHQALRRAIRQLDSGKIHSQAPGGWLDRATGVLNLLGGVLFVVGVVFAGTFGYYNMR